MNSDDAAAARRLPIGAVIGPFGAHFRVWAPERRSVAVVMDRASRSVPLKPDGNGYFAGIVPGARAGDRYRLRLDRDPILYPDPAARHQPDGPHGPSALVDPTAFAWSDAGWKGGGIAGQIIYEIHVGTFTPEGTWAAAAEKLPLLKEIGITLIEMMPVADFPGRFGWGYDGVNLFAPCRLYGTPDDLRRFVNAAHRLGIGVILDVVYNHFGPDGNYLGAFARDYFKPQQNEWGDAINFDGPGSGPVREFFRANARYWIEEFHFDGLRLDATQAIHDASATHIIAEIVADARAAAGDRQIVIVAESETQETRLVRPRERGGHGADGVWNDDFHHSALVAMGGRRRAYYTDHAGTPQEFIASAKYGYLFQGQFYSWQAARRGHPGLDLPASAFISFIENHDQVANTGHGARFHQRTTPGRARAMTALVLLGPQTPMLFQGQEFWASTPFLYFADHKPELAEAIQEGRRTFLAQFPNLADEDMSVRLPNPSVPATFTSCILNWTERSQHVEAVALHRDLIRLRREMPEARGEGRDGLDGAVLGLEAFCLRVFAADDRDWLLLFNLGADLNVPSIADPLVAPPAGMVWHLVWSSENPRYGGGGTAPVEHDRGWTIPGHAAIVMKPTEATEEMQLPEAPRNPALKEKS
ncbi:MAG: malto-oligosyltrehalose trehalohydrolase [Bauldia sp.]